ncbi:RsmE family RNA methyltransferase [Lactobacillus terrae]|uniref:RsmE family RNA methyltransferase n=1 Tax=Lactobacillus terrae TaxID=2269374 RepID=UPI000C1B6441|nr:16S rRNA (uracil(1498)-N(3))-methyltransferase [Lactobacillus terrae]
MEQYFVNNIINSNRYTVDDKDLFKHIAVVLRHQTGDELFLVDQSKALFKAIIDQIDVDGKQIIFDVEKDNRPSTEMPVDLIVACSLSKKDKVEWIAQKSTELGAKKIILFSSKYSIMNWKSNIVEKKISRINEIVKNAAQQSKRRIIPEVIYYSSMKDLLKESAESKIVAYEESAKDGEQSLMAKELAKKPTSIIGVFGPEGGFAPEEIDFLKESGYTAAGLGPRIMRAETAPMYFLSAISFNYELQQLGDN